MAMPQSPRSQGHGSVRRWSGWKPLGITVGAIGITVFAFLKWYGGSKPDPEDAERQVQVPKVKYLTNPAMPQPVILASPLQSVVLDREDGRGVFRIVAVKGGEELIVDAASGRLIAVRDSEGRTTWRPAEKEQGLPINPTKS